MIEPVAFDLGHFDGYSSCGSSSMKPSTSERRNSSPS